MATVGVLRETAGRERRVALTPDGAGRLRKQDVSVLVEAGAGSRAWFGDIDYEGAGAVVVTREQVYAESDVLLCLHPPEDVVAARPGQLLVGLLGPLTDLDLAQRLASAGITAISLDLLPRTLSRAQSMDALTSQANVAGYKAALLAAEAYAGFFPMLMTAAGTTRPAQVLVLGAGVAGLQAIATARRLGALVTGYDVREAARADIASTGAAVLDVSVPRGDGEGGYARTLSEDEGAAQQQGLDAAIPRFDVVITTAQVPGGPAPRLVSGNALAGMRPGSVLVDLASTVDGGNVEGSIPDTRVVTDAGITIIGAGNLASTVPAAASTAYARNLLALLTQLMPRGEVVLDLDDDVQAAVVVTHGGRLVNPRVRAALADFKEIRS
ncbi:NAD(P) transhydrogenase subunit alpha [Paractinoplanes durhamensis]|uniref:proton-translocating NAD(P)(+) transhydrogenase n=1 Tax=Paractinoplanes durhamensis TaxID=113563 RepID=A0ABQ3Z4E5_9ACTN|nr:NAD(P) transhydrogenase subunit alpha [Actinoplanes durhamensis]GIE04700.1 NAD(P) transhydrogenase subunit alpha [Actinoplanes durhamensis]